MAAPTDYLFSQGQEVWVTAGTLASTVTTGTALLSAVGAGNTLTGTIGEIDFTEEENTTPRNHYGQEVSDQIVGPATIRPIPIEFDRLANNSAQSTALNLARGSKVYVTTRLKQSGATNYLWVTVNGRVSGRTRLKTNSDGTTPAMSGVMVAPYETPRELTQ